MLHDFQASSSRQGADFEALCNGEFKAAGCTLLGPMMVKAVGVQIDQVVELPSGRTIWVECKGSVNGNRPGLLRTDTMKKAIANGALIDKSAEYWVVSSHLPHRGASFAMMQQALKLGYVSRFVHINDIATAAREGA